jgi:hypothetical protein
MTCCLSFYDYLNIVCYAAWGLLFGTVPNCNIENYQYEASSIFDLVNADLKRVLFAWNFEKVKPKTVVMSLTRYPASGTLNI